MDAVIDHRKLYRLPWSLPDNSIAWLEPTSKCNLYCEGCYRENVSEHKSLSEVAAELDVFTKYRSFDGVSIAGGDPLTHPQIVDIVRMVKDRGYKPIINTNGLALTEELCRDLKKAGAVGFTFHIDSRQTRPHWKGKNELELCALRLEKAELLARVGGLFCSFNSTVYQETMKYIPDLVAWAQEHIDIVHTMVFILYRAATLEGSYDYYAGGDKVDVGGLVYSTPTEVQRSDINAREIVRLIQERFPDFTPAAYLNGTEKADSFKWLAAGRIGTKKKIYGHMGPKAMEAIQSAYHLFTGRYLAYAGADTLKLTKLLLALGAIDPGLRAAAKRVLADPLALLKPMHFQAITIIQPIDILEDGRQNMCDGCPDMTVWENGLAWSCRLEECRKFGCFVRTAPKGRRFVARVRASAATAGGAVTAGAAASSGAASAEPGSNGRACQHDS